MGNPGKSGQAAGMDAGPGRGGRTHPPAACIDGVALVAWDAARRFGCSRRC